MSPVLALLSARALLTPLGGRLYPRAFFSSRPADDPFVALSPAVRSATTRLAAALERARIPYAVAGAVACSAHGHHRATVAVDVLVSRADVLRISGALVGGGWLPRYAGARRSWRDTLARADVNVRATGEFPGDGCPKPVSFPDVSGAEGTEWVGVDATADGTEGVVRVRVLALVPLVQVKLASAASAPHRRKDAADVGALIVANALPREFACELDVPVRELFLQLWEEQDEARRKGL